MTLHPNNMLFFFMMLFSIVMVISVDSWLFMWLFLEVNMISFIPFLMKKKNKYQSESTLKYFLTQAVASIFFLVSIIFMSYIMYMKMLMVISLMIKMGTAPVHQWFINMVESLSWESLFLLFTLQKMSVFIVLSNNMITYDLTELYLFFIFCSAMTGALGGLYQSSFRKILAFSSVANKSWLIASLILNKINWLMYFFFYSIMLMSVLSILKKFKMTKMTNLMMLPKHFALLLCLNLMSMSGLPPFTGFFNKMMVVLYLNKTLLKISIIPLLIGSLISLFFYMRISFYTLTNNYTSKFKLYGSSSSIYLMSNMTGLLLGPVLFMLL